MSYTAIERDDQLETAKATIKELQRELEATKKQLEILRQESRKFERLAITDDLTGLYNQRYFHDKLKHEVMRNRRQRHSLCLLFLDVDGLKNYNDEYGHSYGDDVLKEVARSLSQSIRTDVDSCFRYGGDEFAVILPETRAEQTSEIAERINGNLRRVNSTRVSLSFGVAELAPEMDIEEFFKCADDAMYVAKKLGNVGLDGFGVNIHIYGSNTPNSSS